MNISYIKSYQQELNWCHFKTTINTNMIYATAMETTRKLSKNVHNGNIKNQISHTKNSKQRKAKVQEQQQQKKPIRYAENQQNGNSNYPISNCFKCK